MMTTRKRVKELEEELALLRTEIDGMMVGQKLMADLLNKLTQNVIHLTDNINQLAQEIVLLTIRQNELAAYVIRGEIAENDPKVKSTSIH